MISNLEISSKLSFSIFRDTIYFSHDGNYIFFIIETIDSLLEKVIILNSKDLSKPENCEYDLS